MKKLRHITVIGLGLLGGSITLAAKRTFRAAKVTGYTHRPLTRKKARALAVATEISNDLQQSVLKSELVILATPIFTFEQTFKDIAPALPAGCIVTDVGSTKQLSHRWAAKALPKNVHYVGSHPIAGSEQCGIEFARDDLFDNTMCIITATKKTNRKAISIVKDFWTKLDCWVKIMTPSEHDKTFANISHAPHILAAALINANDDKTLKFAGKGFLDTSRIASGPVNIWSDIFLTNKVNTTKSIDKLISELEKIKKAIDSQDRQKLEKLLSQAKKKRNYLLNYKIKRKELSS